MRADEIRIETVPQRGRKSARVLAVIKKINQNMKHLNYVPYGALKP